jgi:hypothetical protein
MATGTLKMWNAERGYGFIADDSSTLIGSLSRSVVILTADIEHEEARAGVRDLSDPTYPVLARSLRTRRENIGVTIASLEAFLQGTPKAA